MQMVIANTTEKIKNMLRNFLKRKKFNYQQLIPIKLKNVWFSIEFIGSNRIENIMFNKNY
jgi:hypothetical protein